MQPAVVDVVVIIVVSDVQFQINVRLRLPFLHLRSAREGRAEQSDSG